MHINSQYMHFGGPKLRNVSHNLHKQGGLRFHPPYPQPPRVVQSNKVYLSQEALLISFSLVLRQINAIR